MANSSQQYENTAGSYSASIICRYLNMLRKRGEFCDVKLVVDNVEYPANKNILVAFSPFFKAMFSERFAEGNQASVKLNNVDGSIMEMILDYAYTADVTITVMNVQALLQAANFLQVESLFKKCCIFLENNITAEDCISLWRFAESYSCGNLMEKARKYVILHFAAVCQENEFLELDHEKLLTIIRSDALNVTNEEIVLDAVTRWFKFKEEERKTVIDTVLSEIRLVYINPYRLYDRINAVEAFRNSPTCKKLMDQVKMYHFLPKRRIEHQSSMTRRRLTCPDIEVMFLGARRRGTTGTTGVCTPWITENGGCIDMNVPLPVYISPNGDDLAPCHRFARNYDYIIYTLGCDAMWKFDFTAGTWKLVAPVAKKRMKTGEVDGDLFAVGGHLPRQSVACSTVERYDADGDFWAEVEPLPNPVFSSDVVSMDGMMYVVGGMKNFDDPSLLLQRYNPRTNEWTQMAPLLTPLKNPLACSLNRKIYAFCRCSNCMVYVYDVSTNQWERCADLNNTFWAGPVVLNGNIFVICKNAVGEYVLERYTPSTNHWKVVAAFFDIRVLFLHGPFLFKRDRVIRSRASSVMRPL